VSTFQLTDVHVSQQTTSVMSYFQLIYISACLFPVAYRAALHWCTFYRSRHGLLAFFVQTYDPGDLPQFLYTPLANYLRQGGYVFIAVSLFVCLLAGFRKTTQPIFTRYIVKVRVGLGLLGRAMPPAPFPRHWICFHWICFTRRFQQ